MNRSGGPPPGPAPAPGPMAAPAAVVVDLDDTLYPQSAYLCGAAQAVGRAADELCARAAHRSGQGGTSDQLAGAVHGRPLAEALLAVLAEGSDRGRTIDRALERCGVPPPAANALLPRLVEAFLSYRPARLPLYPGVAEALTALRARYPVGCLTDGTPRVQRAKLTATGLTGAFDAIVLSDELGGRAARKPDPAGLRAVSALLGTVPCDVVVIGDRPDKDMAVARAAGARSIRVATGEYAGVPGRPAATADVADFAEAARFLLALS